MSEATDTKAVDEGANAGAKPAAEAGTDARNEDDLDELLSRWDTEQSPGKSDSEPEVGAEPDLKTLANRFEAMERAETVRQSQADMAKVVETIRGDLDPEVFDDKWIGGWVEAEAQADRRLMRAWANRREEPKAFQRVVEGLGRTFHKKVSRLYDKRATDDRTSVTAALRGGASKKAPEAGDIDEQAVKKMGDAEFYRYRRSMHAK